MYRIADNSYDIEFGQELETNLSLIANKTISDLIAEDNQNLLIFPSNIEDTEDRIGKERILSLHNSKLTTGNIMGFIGVNNCELTIHSRFQSADNDYFLHYMLQKVFAINIFDLKHSISNESAFDFLLYLFPYYLKKALRQGLYKEYHKKRYNDSNVKGSVDLNSHLRSNIPFSGKVAYSLREHSFNNKITQLIRHTIEFIKQHKYAHGILNVDAETQNCVNQIIQITPNFDYKQQGAVVKMNLKAFSHPYYFEYQPLKKICMQILRYEGLMYGDEKDKIYGLLFDGAWLWEEYLNTFLVKCGFKHPQNKKSNGAIYLFKGSRGQRYPDFYKENFILDAKYKRLDWKNADILDRNDMNQIISYMYVQKALIGGFVYPSTNNELPVTKKKHWDS